MLNTFCWSHGVGKLFNALLHCNASDLVLEILKHDKIWGDNLHQRTQLQILGDSSPRFLVIYAHGYGKC